MENPTHKIPVTEEQVDVSKREVTTGHVRVGKRVNERDETVHGSLLAQEVDVERIAVNREVDGPLEPRTDGDWTVIPVVEEVLVVEKRWVLKEELRVRRRSVEQPFEQKVTLRSEEAFVERRRR